jgi:hypothetical protein
VPQFLCASIPLAPFLHPSLLPRGEGESFDCHRVAEGCRLAENRKAWLPLLGERIPRILIALCAPDFRRDELRESHTFDVTASWNSTLRIHRFMGSIDLQHWTRIGAMNPFRRGETFNLRPRTSNAQFANLPRPLDVECWVLPVHGKGWGEGKRPCTKAGRRLIVRCARRRAGFGCGLAGKKRTSILGP